MNYNRITMVMSKYRNARREVLKEKVIDLYKKGYTFREVSNALEISHETARKLWIEHKSTG